MTASSVRAFSVSEAGAFSVSERPLPLGAQDLHLWFCPRAKMASSDHFKRIVLSRYAPVAPQDWRFTLGLQGKPAVVDPPRPLDFNLSDSGAWLTCAVTAGTSIGLDLEYCDPGREVLKVARRFFRPGEIAALDACDGAQQSALFYDYWTLKEARIKARGAALGAELESCGFELTYPAGAAGSQRAGKIAQAPLDPLAEAYYCLLDPIPDYRLAICWFPGGDFQPCLRLYELAATPGDKIPSLSLRAVSKSVL